MKRIVTLLAYLLLAVKIFSQTPQKMSYQAVIRDADNNLITNSAVGMQVSILQGFTKVYVEMQTGFTNTNGLISFEIGGGKVVYGDFTTIDWSNGIYFVETETDPTGGTNYTIKGISQLLSVPYALHAQTAEHVKDRNFETIENNKKSALIEQYIINQIDSVQTANLWINGYVKGKLLDNGGQVYNVKMYGAIGDGITDDGSAINNALSAAGSNGGGIVFMPAGTYFHTQTIVVPSNTHLMGSGIGSTTILGNSLGMCSGLGASSCGQIAMIGVDRAKVSGLTVDNATNGTTTNGIIMVSNLANKPTTNSTIENCEVLGAPGHQYLIWNQYGKHNKILNNYIDGGHATNTPTSGQDGIEIYGGEDILVQGNTLVNIGSTAMWAFSDSADGSKSNCTGIRFIDNYVDGSRYGITSPAMTAYTNIHVKNNTIRNIWVDGIKMSAGASGIIDDYQISGNSVVNCVNSGITISGQVGTIASNIIVCNNVIDNISSGIGIQISTIQNVSCTGNTVTNTNTGIYSVNGINIYIDNNIIHNTQLHGIYLLNITNVTCNHNKIENFNLVNSANYGIKVANTKGGGIVNNQFKTDIKTYSSDALSTGLFTEFNYAGRKGFGTEVPVSRVTIKGEPTASWHNTALTILSHTFDTDGARVSIYKQAGANTSAVMQVGDNGKYQAIHLNPYGGNVGIGTTINNLTDKLFVNGSVNSTSYKLLGTELKLSPFKSGSQGTSGTILTSTGASTDAIWKTLSDAGIATSSVYPAIGLTIGYVPYKSNTVLANSGFYWDTNNQRGSIGTTHPQAKLHVSGGNVQGIRIESSVNTAVLDLYQNNGSVYSNNRNWRIANNYTTSGTLEFLTGANSTGIPLYAKLIINKDGNVGIGYSSGTEINNNKLAVNGSAFINGIIATIGGRSVEWNTAYGWGNHAGLYRPINYVPTWSEISSNPFSFSSVSSNQLLKYNSTTSKWENWTPNFLTNFTESDPNFAAWNKTSGIIITTSQISDFQTIVSKNTAVIENSAKNSYPSADAAKLSGIETGAEVNVNADWNATSGDAQIHNKPTILAGTNSGDMQYWDGFAWVVVPAGKPGQFLQFTASNIPTWTTVLPVLTTTEASDITNNSATIGGNITSDGGGTITARGVCWSTSSNPTLSDNKTTDGTGTGLFTSLITGLANGTTYYIRAYATNASFTAYGNQVYFTTTP